MVNNEIKIQIPDGMMIDEENSTFTHIKFKLIKKELPKRWEDLKEINGYFVDKDSYVGLCEHNPTIDRNKNIFPTKELAEAALALAQLLQLRDNYNDGWIPDYNNNSKHKFAIFVKCDCITFDTYENTQKILTFKTPELRKEFYNNFKDLLEIAKPLL